MRRCIHTDAHVYRSHEADHSRHIRQIQTLRELSTEDSCLSSTGTESLRVLGRAQVSPLRTRGAGGTC